MKTYQLMHLDDEVAELEIDDSYDGQLKSVARIHNRELVPYRACRSEADFRDWWRDRAVPETRTALRDLLDDRGVKSTGQFLLDNLALSLSDCYWIRPKGLELSWSQVNLYGNEFSSRLVVKDKHSSGAGSASYTVHTPDASTGGNLPKWWIVENGTRFLIKGNDGPTSQQSLNEVLATMIHTAQGWTNHVKYRTVKLPDGKYGCKCAAFTSIDEEFISAWDLIGRRDYAKDEPSRMNFLHACIEGGLDGTAVSKGLDYMFMTDFIMSNSDRHLNNFGVMRNTRTLKFTRLAPLFDSGNSMMYKAIGQISLSSSLEEETHGFFRSYRAMLEHVSDSSLVDLSRLPDSEEMTALYEKDPVVAPFARRLANLLSQRCMILDGIQNGMSCYDAFRRQLHSPLRRH